MDALAYAKLHPKAFHRKFIEKGVRPDRRQLLEYRDIKISTGSVATADASALVRLGDSVSTAAPCVCFLNSARVGRRRGSMFLW